jgi:hypothetical protein
MCQILAHASRTVGQRHVRGVAHESGRLHIRVQCRKQRLQIALRRAALGDQFEGHAACSVRDRTACQHLGDLLSRDGAVAGITSMACVTLQ